MAKDFAVGGKLSSWFINIGMKASCFYVVVATGSKSDNYTHALRVAFDSFQIAYRGDES